jgi:hypothetical protein
MKIQEIKKTVEQVVGIRYIAEDGTEFKSAEECKAYEDSAMFIVLRKLKKVTTNNLSEYSLIEAGSDDNELEIFDIQTQEDLDNLRRYLYLKLIKSGAKEENFKDCFTSVDGKRTDYVFDNLTYGHEVMIFWSYENDWFWVYDDGSVEGYCRFIKRKYEQIIKSMKEENKGE